MPLHIVPTMLDNTHHHWSLENTDNATHIAMQMVIHLMRTKSFGQEQTKEIA